MPENAYARRRAALKRALAQRGMSALLVSHAANRYYLSGFELSDPQCNESSGWLVITAKGKDYLLTDPRFDEAARRTWDQELVIYTSRKFDTVGPFLKGLGLDRLCFESRAVCVHAFELLKEFVALEPTQGLVEDLRMIKDAEELRLLEESCALNHRVMRRIETLLKPGMSEAEAAWEVEKLFREGGAEALSFDTIVGVGPNAALPHAIPGETLVRENDLVLVDAGGRLKAYCSDQTRTFWIGPEPSERFRTVRRQVREAQKRAMAVIRPGAAIAEAYRTARAYFEEEGVAPFFTHGLGHGIGLETHEAPSLSSVTEGAFRPGMVVTVEPGLYYPDWGGVRWEFMVAVTEDGCRALEP